MINTELNPINTLKKRFRYVLSIIHASIGKFTNKNIKKKLLFRITLEIGFNSIPPRESIIRVRKISEYLKMVKTLTFLIVVKVLFIKERVYFIG